MEALTFLALPFAACILLVLIHVYFGVHVLERGIIFVDLAMAQFIGIGIALSFLVGEEKGTILSTGFAILGAFLVSLAKKATRYVNVEAFIGVLYIFAFSVAILILDRSPHGMEEFKAIMNGNIIWTSDSDVLRTLVIYGILGAIHFIFRRRFFALTYEGKGGMVLEFLFFATFAVMLVVSVKLAGILQVFSFLVIPALIGRLYFRTVRSILLTGWAVGIAVSLSAVGASYALDLPTSPFIVVGLASTFFVLLLIRAISGRREPPGN